MRSRLRRRSRLKSNAFQARSRWASKISRGFMDRFELRICPSMKIHGLGQGLIDLSWNGLGIGDQWLVSVVGSRWSSSRPVDYGAVNRPGFSAHRAAGFPPPRAPHASDVPEIGAIPRRVA